MHQTKLQALDLVPSSQFKRNFSELPEVLFYEIALFGDLYTLLVLTATSKQLHNLFHRNTDLYQRKFNQLFSLNFPYLINIFPNHLHITEGNNLLSNYIKALQNSLNKYNSILPVLTGDQSKLRENFNRLIEIGNPAAAALCLKENNQSKLLLSLRSFSGNTIIRELSRGLSEFKYNSDLTGFKIEPLELKAAPIFKFIFNEMLQTEFGKILGKNPFDRYAGAPNPELIIDKIISSIKFTKRESSVKGYSMVELEPQHREHVLRLYVISYACRQFDIFARIQKLFSEAKLDLSISVPVMRTVTEYCIHFGELALMRQLLNSFHSKVYFGKMLNCFTHLIIKNRDSDMLRLIFQYNHTLETKDVIQIIETKDPVMTRELLQCSLITPGILSKCSTENIFKQMLVFGVTAVNLFLEKFKSIPITTMDYLVELILDLRNPNLPKWHINAFPKNYFYEVIKILINNNFDIETIYEEKSTTHCFHGKTLIEMAAGSGLPDLVKLLIEKKPLKSEVALKHINSLYITERTDRHVQCAGLLTSQISTFKNNKKMDNPATLDKPSIDSTVGVLSNLRLNFNL